MSSIRVCEQCIKENKKSTIRIVHPLITTTASYSPLSNSYYDEEGKYHCHRGTSRIDARCSNGHDLVFVNKYKCANCDYESF